MFIVQATGQNVMKRFTAEILNFRYNFEYISPESLSSRAQCLQITQGAYPRLEHLKVDSLEQALALLANIRLGWKGLQG
jgi:hypothetical protein